MSHYYNPFVTREYFESSRSWQNYRLLWNFSIIASIWARIVRVKAGTDWQWSPNQAINCIDNETSQEFFANIMLRNINFLHASPFSSLPLLLYLIFCSILLKIFSLFLLLKFYLWLYIRIFLFFPSRDNFIDISPPKDIIVKSVMSFTIEKSKNENFIHWLKRQNNNALIWWRNACSLRAWIQLS